MTALAAAALVQIACDRLRLPAPAGLNGDCSPGVTVAFDRGDKRSLADRRLASLLLEFGADTSAHDATNNAALDYASHAGNADLISLLRQARH